jgi:hypothetical protein
LAFYSLWRAILKVKLLHHSFEWVSGDFEPPKSLSDESHLIAWRIHTDARTGLIGMSLHGFGAAVWNSDGKLLFCPERGADLAWDRGSTDLFSLEYPGGRCQQGKGIRSVLKRLEVGSFRTLDEIDVCIPTGGARYLVPNHKGDKCLVTWLDQSEWGYVMVDLTGMRQIPDGLLWPSPNVAPPDFSPDDSFIVSCHFFSSGWWTDAADDYWESPSPGGVFQAGAISVHEVATNTITHHDVLIDLPQGWRPDRPDSSDWDAIWGPEFVSNTQFRIWLPDDSEEFLTLPLPPQIEVRRGLATHRKWTD